MKPDYASMTRAELGYRLHAELVEHTPDHGADCEFAIRRLLRAAAMVPANEPKATVKDTQ
jgi:hypothetical protein